MASAVPNWQPLQGAIAGEVVLPGSPVYEGSCRPFNARFREVRPSAVVSCATPEDASETISFARRHGLQTAARSGGHSFAGHSATTGIVIDVSAMRSVSVSDGVAIVGAGARLGDLYEELQVHDLTIPGGTCPSVGVSASRSAAGSGSSGGGTG